MTRTSTVPVPGGTMAVIVVSEVTVKLEALAVPKRTFVTLKKFVPVIVTVLPPLVGPEFGLMLVTVSPKFFWDDWIIVLVPLGLCQTAIALFEKSIAI